MAEFIDVIDMNQFIEIALPGVREDVIKRLIERLTEIGVINFEDITLVEAIHINDILPPIQVKKLLKFFAEKSELNLIENINSSTSTTTSYLDTSDIVSNDLEYSNFALPLSDDWMKDFKIPWALFPKEALKACTEKTFLQKKYKSEVVRIIVNEILKVVPSPGRKHYRSVAKIVVDKYPETFQDQYDSIVVAGGYTSLMKKIEDACDNRKRRSDIVYKFFAPDNCQSIKRRKTSKNSYGCLNWQPTDLPSDETRESQKYKKEFLIEEYTKEIREIERIDDAMEKTYPSQRFTINNGLSINDIKNEWPFLLEEKYLLNHYKMLMGHDIYDKFFEAIPMKGKKILNFMRTKRNRQIMECINIIDNWRETLQNSSPEIIGSILLLMVNFNEDVDVLFQVHKEAANIKEIEEKTTLMTPFIVTLSEHLFTSEEFIIFCDGKACIITKNFVSAMASLFAAYFVFNIEYPEAAEITLEFIQRLYAGVNPLRGSKKKGSKQRTPVHTKILKIVNELKSFESVFNL